MTLPTMHRNPRRKAPALAALVVAALVLSACTDGGNEAEQQTDKRGGTLSVVTPVYARPDSILTKSGANPPWQMNVFEGLVTYGSDSLEPKPDLATKWALSKDGLTMDITLRDDVTFHTGRKMTADDVKWSFEKAADPTTGSQVGFVARNFESIKVTSPTALTLTFKSPMSNIFDFFAQTVIVDKETYDGLKDGSKVIGTGPYVWGEFVAGASYTLTRNEKYRDTAAANFDKITYEVVADPTAQASALRSRRAQYAYQLASVPAGAFRNDDAWTVATGGGIIYPFGMDVTVAPFDNKEVRQAIAYAIDRERINKQVFDGTGLVTDLYWPESAVGYSAEQAKHYAYDAAKATDMIKAAGAAGAAVPILYIQAAAPVAQIIANNLKAVGLAPTLTPLDGATFATRQAKGDLGPVFLSTHAQVGYTPATLISSTPTLRKGNPSKFWTPEYEQLQKALAGAASDAENTSALQALSAYQLDQAFVTAVVQAPELHVYSSEVKDVHISSLGAILLKDAYLAR